jgi:hypothetical protein
LLLLLLLLPLLWFLTAQHAAEYSAHRVAFVAEHAVQQAAGGFRRIAGGGQQVTQPHLGHGLHVGSEKRMRHIAADDDRQHQLAFVIGERGIQVSADFGPADRLAYAAGEHCCHVHVDVLIYKIQCAIGRERAGIEHRRQVIRVSDAVDDVQCTGKFPERGAGAGRLGGRAVQELTDLRNFAQNIDVLELAVGDVEIQSSI